MALLQVHERISHAFDDGWAAHDSWEHRGAAKLLAERQVRAPEALGDDGDYIVNAVALRRPADKRAARQFAKALADTLSFSGCQHDHDCCGCPSQYARVLHMHVRRFVLRLSRRRNC